MHPRLRGLVETWGVKCDNPFECLVKDRTLQERCLFIPRSPGSYKLAEAAEKSWGRLDGHNQLSRTELGSNWNKSGSFVPNAIC